MNYSTDFNFFLSHQMRIVKLLNGETHFLSAIKSQLFKRLKTSLILNKEDLLQECKKIHESVVKLQKKGVSTNNEFVLFNISTKKPVRYSDENGCFDILLFADEQEAELSQLQGEEVIRINELPLVYQLEIQNNYRL